MKFEHQVLMQQRHLKTIVEALRFRWRMLSGDVYGTLGKAAMEAWETLPIVAHDAYPARVGEKEMVRAEVLDACRAIEEATWHGRKSEYDFSESPEGRIVGELMAQCGSKAKRTRFKVKLRKGMLRKIGWAVEFEMRVRISHLAPPIMFFPVDPERRDFIEKQCDWMKAVAWQIVGGNYGPWFTYKTKMLYDIYSVVEHEYGSWRYAAVHQLVRSVPLMEVS